MRSTCYNLTVLFILLALDVAYLYSLYTMLLLNNLLMFVACLCLFFFFFQAEDGIRDIGVTGVQTCALPISGHLPLVPGHQIVGVREDTGARVGIPWLGWTCGTCRYCTSGRENLCDGARFTGRDVDGGFAELTVADERFCLPLPDGFGDVEAAPLLCGGLIGYRALRLAGDAETLGIYGFGSAAHIVCQVAVHEGRRVHAFTRSGDEAGQAFARSLGAVWAGGADR